MQKLTSNSPRRRAAVVTIAAVALLLLAAIPGRAARKPADGTVSGTVTARTSGETLSSVEISLSGPDGVAATAKTDGKGKFKIKVPEGEYLMRLTREGYAPFEVELPVQPGSGQVVTVEMLDAAEGRRSEAANLFNAGMAAYRGGDTAAAKESLIAAAEADPALVEPRRVLAGIYLEERSWAEAARQAEAARAIAPEDNQSLRVLYEAYRQLGDPRAPEARRALAGDPGLAGTLAKQAFNEGALADQGGDHETAAARFREALELDPGLAVAHFALGGHEYRAERYDAALAAAREGLGLEPNSVQGRRLAFISLDAMGDAEAAAAALDAYAEVDPESVIDLLYRRGEAGFLNGDFAAGRKALQRIHAYRPDHAHAHRLLGLMAASSDVAAAKRHLNRFLELAPDDPEAATVRQVLAEL